MSLIHENNASSSANQSQDIAASDQKILLQCLKGEKTSRRPVWLMRQAGRYLPEYRALRAEKGGFLDMVYDSEAAATVTMQPIDRFGFDGAILFSDILMIPHAMGQNLTFTAGEGPRLTPKMLDSSLESLEAVPSYLSKIYETVGKVKDRLPSETSFLGFSGSPWTIATYMVNGEGSRDQSETRRFAYGKEAEFSVLIDAVIDLTVEYLSGQVNAGVEAVQLFDSWAGSLSPKQFEKWVIEPNATITSRFKALHPDVPVIGFPKGAGGKLGAYAAETGVDALGLDETVDPAWANSILPKDLPVQGNLDPLALIAGGEALSEAAQSILDIFSDRPHIFNLGHGILPDTPLEHVAELLTLVRETK